MAKYYLRTGSDDTWREVTRAQFVQAEKDAGFAPNHNYPGEPATAAFSCSDNDLFIQGYTDPLARGITA